MFKRRFTPRAIIISLCIVILVFGGFLFLPWRNLGGGTKHEAGPSGKHNTSNSPVKVQSLAVRTSLATNPPLYDQIHVQDAKGNPKVLSVKTTPLFFFSYWTGQAPLIQLKTEWNEFQTKPVLICTGWPKGTSIKDAVSKTDLLLKQVGLTNAEVDYFSQNPFGTYVSGLPDTYVWQSGHVYHVPGTLPSASDWLKVFNGGLAPSK
jgi:hypothetical protein